MVSAQLFKGGVMAGIVASQVAGDSYSGFNKAGVFGGGYIYWMFTQHSALQFEIDFVQKGSRHNPDAENDDFESYILRVNYIEAPLLYRFFYSKKLSFEIGPSVGFLMSHFEERDYNPVADNPFKETVLSGIIGLNYAITENIKVDFRTSNSISSIRKNNFGVKRFTTKWGQFNDALILSVHYQF